jgi:hypothetical protein
MTGPLTGMVPLNRPERGPGGDEYPLPPAAPPGAEISVYLVNAVRTSAGCGPGVLRLPAAEANRLIAAKLAVYGDQPPRNFLDGGQPGPSGPVREFR